MGLGNKGSDPLRGESLCYALGQPLGPAKVLAEFESNLEWRADKGDDECQHGTEASSEVVLQFISEGFPL